MSRRFAATVVWLLLASPAAAQTSTQDATTFNLTAYAELLRSDVRTQKIVILTEIMGFDEKEDAAFWPIYREYDLEMSAIGDERAKLIAEYARNFEKLTDAVADGLATQAIDLDARRRAVLAKC